MAFRRDVEYIDDLLPPAVRLNAEEYQRVVWMIEAVLPDLIAAPGKVEWASEAKDLYVSRLKEAESLAQDLRGAFAAAGLALREYATQLTAAKAKLDEGDTAAESLANLVAPIIWYQTPTFQQSEPLAQWEDLRKITFWSLDALAEFNLRDEIDRIRGRAESCYEEGARLYDKARSIERDGRAECIADLGAAFKKLPDFKADSAAAENIIKSAPGVMVEMEEAAALDKDARLPGQGVVPEFGVDGGDRSDTHQNLLDRAGNIQLDEESWDTGDFARWNAPLGSPEEEKQLKLDWIKNYGPVIEAAAYEYGIPAEVLAGVVYMEVGGKPMWMDDAVDWARQHNLYPGNPDDTSYGPLAVQVDTAATALGYDSDNLSDKQRDEIISSLKDPKQNIMITAKVLADGKDATDFATTDPGAMTADQGRHLAAVYNGGPNPGSDHAQSYADTYAENVDEAGKALR